MERRVLLAIFLAFLVLYTWQALFVKPVPKPVPGATTATTTSTEAESPGPPATTAGISDAAQLPRPAPQTSTPTAPLAAALVSETAERDVRVATRDVIAVFT